MLQPKSLPLITRLPIPYCLGVGVAGVDKDMQVDVQVAMSVSWSLSTWCEGQLGDPFDNG